MISFRYGMLVSIIIILALVPTLLLNYIGIKACDGLVTEAISTTLVGLESKATERRETWVMETYASKDWIEREYSTLNRENILLFVARSFDIKRLYHHPELGVLRGIDLEREGIEYLSEMQNLPVHLLRKRTGSGLAAYVLLYDNEFINNPFRFQIRNALESLLSPKKMMTLFLVYEAKALPDTPFKSSLAAQIFVAAIQSFNSQIPKMKFRKKAIS